jgi:hypothetical protein
MVSRLRASVDSTDDTPEGSVKRMPILDGAAARADVATFELLRARGAPLDYNYSILPRAVIAANNCVPDAKESPSMEYERRMDMVHHPVDVVGCNVKSKSNGPYASGSVCGTPLCWIACYQYREAKELVCFQLDRGGDLDLARPDDGHWSALSARDSALQHQTTYFLRSVKEWQAGRNSVTTEEHVEGRRLMEYGTCDALTTSTKGVGSDRVGC